MLVQVNKQLPICVSKNKHYLNFSYAVKWLDLQRGRMRNEELREEEIEKQIETLTEQVMMHIRFPMMSPRQLAELLLSPLVKKYKEFFVERMGIGMIYHSGQEDRVQELYFSNKEKLLFTPRLYTSDNYSLLALVNNFSSLPAYSTHKFTFSSRTLADYQGE